MLCNANPRNKENKNQRIMVTKNSNEAQGSRKPRQIKDTESHQLLNEESQTYFYQKVW